MQQAISAPRNTCSKNFLQQLIDAAEYFCYIFSDLRVVVVLPMQLPGHDADCPNSNSFKFQKIVNAKMVRTWCTTTSVSFYLAELVYGVKKLSSTVLPPFTRPHYRRIPPITRFFEEIFFILFFNDFHEKWNFWKKIDAET